MSPIERRARVASLLVSIVVCAALAATPPALARQRPAPPPDPCAWTQWGRGPAHDGQVCAPAQRAEVELAHLVIDPFAPQEEADSHGELYDGDLFVLGSGGN